MNYLIPSNTKKGLLLFGLFRKIDAIIFGTGLGITLFLLLMFPADNTLITVLILAPLCISAILIAPIPNYHNVLVVIQNLIEFLNTRQRLIWKGWCSKDGEDSKK